MPRSPTRAEVVGSLLRPRIPEGGEDEAIARLVQQQIDIGLDVVTDGELRRFMFQDSERFGPSILIEAATPRF